MVNIQILQNRRSSRYYLNIKLKCDVILRQYLRYTYNQNNIWKEMTWWPACTPTGDKLNRAIFSANDQTCFQMRQSMRIHTQTHSNRLLSKVEGKLKTKANSVTHSHSSYSPISRVVRLKKTLEEPSTTTHSLWNRELNLSVRHSLASRIT